LTHRGGRAQGHADSLAPPTKDTRQSANSRDAGRNLSEILTQAFPDA
jgi:hypothetical protein